MQPALSKLVAINNSTNSIYVWSKKNFIYQAFADIYIELGLNTVNNKFPGCEEIFDK